ncbi:hypothetical protein D499_0X00380 [Hanseniaspora uvarum DSM 2768]|nr:hypothetical protein D499_0X00380 [Hanseniaspora uvarum DSM 2768]
MSSQFELKYNRNGTNLKKKESHFLSSKQTTLSSSILNNHLAKYKKLENAPIRRDSFLLNAIEDNISDATESKRNSLISVGSSVNNPKLVVKPNIIRRRSSLYKSIKQTPSNAEAIKKNNSFYQFAGLNIDESRYGNPTEENLILSDINEQINKNNLIRETKESNGISSLHDENTNGPEIEDEEYADYDAPNFTPIANSQKEFANEIQKNEPIGNSYNDMNKDYLDDINIELTPPAKSQQKLREDELRENGLESFVADYGDYNKQEAKDDQRSDMGSDGYNEEADSNEKVDVDIIKRSKLDLKDPINQVDASSDGEYDYENEKLEIRNSESGDDDISNEVAGLNVYGSSLEGSDYDSQMSSEDDEFDITDPEELENLPPRPLRRSKRTKVPTLDHWRNERIIYKKDSAGPFLGIDYVIKHDKRYEIQEEDLTKRKRKQTRTATIGKNKTRRGRKKKLSKSASERTTNLHIYEKIDSGEIPGSDWLKYGIFETEVKDNDNYAQEVVVAYAPDTASETIPTVTDKDDFTLCYTLKKHISKEEVVRTGFFKFPVETGRKSKKQNICKWLQFVVLNGVAEIKLYQTKTESEEGSTVICIKNSEFTIPTNSFYTIENIGEDELQLNFTMINRANQKMDKDIETLAVIPEHNEISEDDEQQQLSRFLDGNGESDDSNIEEKNLRSQDCL